MAVRGFRADGRLEGSGFYPGNYAARGGWIEVERGGLYETRSAACLGSCIVGLDLVGADIARMYRRTEHSWGMAHYLGIYLGTVQGYRKLPEQFACRIWNSVRQWYLRAVIVQTIMVQCIANDSGKRARQCARNSVSKDEKVQRTKYSHNQMRDRLERGNEMTCPGK